MAENKCAARLEHSSRDMSELKNRFKPGYDWETICSTMLEHLMCGVAMAEEPLERALLCNAQVLAESCLRQGRKRCGFRRNWCHIARSAAHPCP